MFKLFILLLVIIGLSGCATWEGIKKDTSDAYDYLKGTVHEATQ
jgi:predicted small secreted protein